MQHLRYKLGFALYWLVFAVFSVFAARSPGYVRHPELAPFPWLGLVIVWLILAVLVTAFYFILKPASIHRSSLRLGVAFTLSLAMVIGSILTMVTDMPGLYYMPHYFSALTFLVLLIASASSAWQALWRKLISPK